MPNRKELESYKPPLTKEQKRFKEKLKIAAEIVNHNKPTLKRKENRDELR